MNPFIFREYDIRGIALREFGETVDLDNDMAYAIGRAFGTHMQQKVRAAAGRKDSARIFCGRDNRLTSEELQQAYISGLLATGCFVTDVGLATSPMIYFASCVYDLDAGTNLTASHNPKQYNGFKFVSKNAISICGDAIQKLWKIIEEESYIDGKGEFHQQEIFPDYLKMIKEKITFKRSHKIILDAGNGVAGKFAPELFTALGAEVIPLHCELDGNFPNHEANPQEEKNMEDVKKEVLKHRASLGVAFDGDGDRVGIVDEKGKFYHADYLLIPLARDLLSRRKGAKVVFDVKSSKVMEDDIRRYGGFPIRYKTGHSFIETKMKQEGALLGGETSGHIFFAENYFGFDDGLFAGAKLLELVDRYAKPFSAFFNNIPQAITTPEYRISCDDRMKFQVVEDVKQYFVKRYPCLTIDGVWIDFGDGAWGACRASNTGPYLTLRFEAKTPQKLALAKKIVFDKLKEYPEVQLGTC